MERLRSECLKCMADSQIGKMPDHLTEAEKIQYLQMLFGIFAKAPMTKSAPEIVWEIDKEKRRLFDIHDEYADVKKYFNEVMLRYEEGCEEKVRAAKDPLKLALQYAMAGNYIDFGAMKNVDEDYLTDLLGKVDKINVDEEQYQQMKKDLEKAKSVVLVTDNCGEIVMDKILVRQIKESYPNAGLTVLVRGEEVLNDATMEDANQVGLEKIAKVVGNGTGIAGTSMDKISAEARELVTGADVIIAKGQGNFETMRKCGLNVYYAFLCKCDMFADFFKVPRFTGMLINDKYC